VHVSSVGFTMEKVHSNSVTLVEQGTASVGPEHRREDLERRRWVRLIAAHHPPDRLFQKRERLEELPPRA
jgi:hypothetical protein